MIRTQRHSRFVLMSLDEIHATRDIVLQTEETKSNFSGSGKTVYICEVVRPLRLSKENGHRRGQAGRRDRAGKRRQPRLAPEG